MTEGLSELQEKYIFASSPGLPERADSIRISPNNGTNMTAIFSESCLSVLGLSEEQLELLADLRSVPESLLSNYQHLDSALDILQHAKSDLLKRSEALIRSIDRLNTQKLRSLEPEKAKTLINLSIAERKAGKNLSVFASHCFGLRARFASLSSGDRAELEVLFDQLEMLLRRLHKIDGYTTAANLFYGDSPDCGAVQSLCQIFTGMDDEFERHNVVPLTEVDILQAYMSNTHHRDNYLRLNDLAQTTITDHLKLQIGAAELSIDSWQQTEQDLDIFRFLLGLNTTRELGEKQMVELVYVYLKNRLVQHLCTTPAELALTSLITEHFSTITSSLLLCSLMSSFICRFTESSSAAIITYRVAEQFRTLSRVGHLLGLRAPDSFKLLAQHCEQVMPYLSAPDRVDICVEFDRIQQAFLTVWSDPVLRCWSYNHKQKPWLPLRVRHSLNITGPFGIIRPDIIPTSLRASDLWMNLKWAGVDIDAKSDTELSQIQSSIGIESFGVGNALTSTIDNRLLHCLFQFAKQDPEKNASFIVAILGLSTRDKPLFFNKDEPDPVPEETPSPVSLPESGGDSINSDEDWPELY